MKENSENNSEVLKKINVFNKKKFHLFIYWTFFYDISRYFQE